MENLYNTKAGDVLPEFQKFLLEKKLAPEKNVFSFKTESVFFNTK
ncbi:MAG TPA: hypothetical protein VI728_09490 [Syntrophales bacterium]|nr:hypothetical protein [Syntrophales bacterium]